MERQARLLDQLDFTPVVVAFSFLIGPQIYAVFTMPFSSSIDTMFVASAWEPMVLIRDHPELYERIVAVYQYLPEAIYAQGRRRVREGGLLPPSPLPLLPRP